MCNGTDCVCTVTIPDDTPIPTEPPIVTCVCNDTVCVCTVEDNIGNGGTGSTPGDGEDNSTVESNCTKKCEEIAKDMEKKMNDTKAAFKLLEHEVRMNKLEEDAKWTHLSSGMEELELKQKQLALLVLESARQMEVLLKNITDIELSMTAVHIPILHSGDNEEEECSD